MKTLRYMLLTITALALLVTCSKEDKSNSAEFPLKTSDNLDESDYRLYSLVMEELFPEPENLVVIQPTMAVSPSRANDYMQSMKEGYPEMDTTLFSGYIQANDSVYYFENKFSVAPRQVILVSLVEIQHIFNYEEFNTGWEEFYRRYPNSGGTLSFSRIGYNTDNTQAMMELGNKYDGLGGQGYMIFLKFTDGEWTIAKINYTWVS